MLSLVLSFVGNEDGFRSRTGSAAKRLQMEEMNSVVLMVEVANMTEYLAFTSIVSSVFVACGQLL